MLVFRRRFTLLGASLGIVLVLLLAALATAGLWRQSAAAASPGGGSTTTQGQPAIAAAGTPTGAQPHPAPPPSLGGGPSTTTEASLATRQASAASTPHPADGDPAPVLGKDPDDVPEDEAAAPSPPLAPPLAAPEAPHGRPVRLLPHYVFPREIDLRKMRLEQGRYVQRLADGTRIFFTLDPVLQQRAERVLASTPVRHGGVVALEPATGRILAWAGRSMLGKQGWALPGDASPAAASTFKVVTAAALLETAPVTESTTVCFHGGYSRLSDSDIVGDPRRDHLCTPFRDALARSANAVFARLAYQHLDRPTLLRYAEGFGFNQEIEGFPVKVQRPRAELPGPKDRLEFARAAAGFWHTYQSPLTGASVIATVANGGVRMQPQLIEQILSPAGQVLYSVQPETVGRVIRADTAARLNSLLRLTVTQGTARARFGNKWRNREVTVAGKTGSLTLQKPEVIAYSWFSAFAPADQPTLAISALVGNGPLWHIKGPDLVREMMTAHFGPQEPTRVKPAPPVAHKGSRSGHRHRETTASAARGKRTSASRRSHR